ncbi:WD40 repeat protein/transcriptional regulator with XRE-family HTH domain [Crossiella equi]|uniref:WD40 repeat protein/transcriptional regulator with XRE-family HTH domain n=1 Tax=Crossiella equi TaxID=130796 RepID=A0ABS5A750_9PSEU|nr:helix-turn-helix domain-containing protein [Crossiella equi]MBP2472418.1 WD40 repeat protein/transcriptional regulator with XRE-family HTH domain [Crossiella equi]
MDPDAGEVQRFAFELRRLREQAGNPSYRDLARVVHYSVSTLSEAARGRKLPSLAVTLAYVRACGGDEEHWEARWRELAREVDLPALDGLDADEQEPPYVGLTAFGPEDAERFFGRERLIDQVLEVLATRRLVVVVGASGSGKSSLLRAGVLPRLTHGVLRTPGPHPMEEAGPVLAGPHEHERTVVVDQFEELFTRCHDVEERQAFVTALTTATSGADSRVKVVLGLRADFYAHCARYPELAEALQDAQILATPMTAEELRQAITRPAVGVGAAVETALLTRLVSEAAGQPAVLPMLSHALVETWRRRRGNTLTLAGYEASGGIEGAIGQTAEAVYDGFSPAQKEIARQVFLRLVELGEGTEDTKRRITRAELDTGEVDVTVVLERLAQSRLLTLDHNSVDIAHEAVIRSWPRLREWLTDDRDGLRVARRIAEAAEEWDRLDRDPGALYRGAQLQLATDWAARARPDVLNRRESDFLTASTAASRREQAAQRARDRRLRQLVALLTTLLLLAVSATGYAVWAEQRSSAQRTAALVQKAVVDAESIKITNPALAWQLRLAAYRADPLREARDAVLSTSAEPYAVRIQDHPRATSIALYSPAAPVLLTAGAGDDRVMRFWDTTNPHAPQLLSSVEGHLAGLHGAEFTPDGKRLVTAGLDRQVRIWDVGDPRSPKMLGLVTGHTAAVEDAALGRDGTLLVTAGADQVVKIWDITDPRSPVLLHELKGFPNLVHGADLSDDGRLLATADWSDAVRVFDLTNPREPEELPSPGGHKDGAQEVVFNHDASLLVTGGSDRLATLWDLRDPRRPRELSKLAGHLDTVHGIAFAPGEKVLATASGDSTVRLWEVSDPANPRDLHVLRGHTDAAWHGTFNADGTQLASSSDDRTVRITDLRRQDVPQHADQVTTVARETGQLIATSGSDGTVRLWRREPDGDLRVAGVVDGRSGDVDAVALTKDSSLLVTGSWDQRARLWDIRDPASPVLLSVVSGHTNAVDQVELSPDGKLMVTTSWDDSFRLWDITDRRDPRPLAKVDVHGSDVVDVMISPDGRTLASAGMDGTARLWDVTTPRSPKELQVLSDYPGGASQVEFTADGRYLGVFGLDRKVRLFDLTVRGGARLVSELPQFEQTVQGIAFSPDGRTLAVAGNDKTVRLWDVADKAKPVETTTLRGHSEAVYRVAFGPEGKFLVGVGGDRTVRLWDIDVERAAAGICAIAHPRITEAQWEHYLPGLPFQPPCPG